MNKSQLCLSAVSIGLWAAVAQLPALADFAPTVKSPLMAPRLAPSEGSKNPVTAKGTILQDPKFVVPIAPQSSGGTSIVPTTSPGTQTASTTLFTPSIANPGVQPTATSLFSPAITIPNHLFTGDRLSITAAQVQPNYFQSGTVLTAPAQSDTALAPTGSKLQQLELRLQQSQSEYEQAAVRLDLLRTEMQHLREMIDKKSPESGL